MAGKAGAGGGAAGSRGITTSDVLCVISNNANSAASLAGTVRQIGPIHRDDADKRRQALGLAGTDAAVQQLKEEQSLLQKRKDEERDNFRRIKDMVLAKRQKGQEGGTIII